MKKRVLIIIIIVIATFLISSIFFMIVKFRNHSKIDNNDDNNWYYEEVIENNKVGEKIIVFLGKEYSCLYEYTHSSFHKGEEKNQYNSFDDYLSNDGKTKFTLSYSTDDIIFYENSFESYGDANITAFEAIDISNSIIFIHKKTNLNYELESCRKINSQHPTYILSYCYILDGHKTDNTIQIKLSSSGILISYKELNLNDYVHLKISIDEFTKCENIIDTQINSKLHEKYSWGRYSDYAVENSYLSYNHSNNKLTLNKIVEFHRSDGGDVSFSFSQEVKYTYKNDDNDFSVIYLDKLNEIIDDNIKIDQEEIITSAYDYLVSIKENYLSFELIEIAYTQFDNHEVCITKFSYKIGNYFTEDIISLILLSNGDVIFVEEENCDRFKDVIISDDKSNLIEEKVKQKYETIKNSGKELRNIKFTVLSFEDNILVFNTIVEVSLSYVPYRIVILDYL